MKFKAKYRICLWKNYFNTGNSLMNYLKYMIAFFGLASRDVTATIVIGCIYAAGCFVLGYIWYNTDMQKADIEVSNQYNMFVKEMRRKYKKGDFIRNKKKT